MEVESTDYDDFPGSVTDSVVIDAKDLCLPTRSTATVREEDGSMRAHLDLDCESYISESDPTFLEFHTPIKLYLRINGRFKYHNTSEGVIIDVPKSSHIILGSRAWRCRPKETITIRDSVKDLCEAISYFGATVSTTSPERAFTTLRGHPPRLRVSDSFEVPQSLSKPEAGITITVPAKKSALLAVAPLAYYLLATVKTGERFTIETDTGFIHNMDSENIPDAAHSALIRCFYLDCLVRTEGLYPFDLQERHDFEEISEVSLDYSKLYGQSLSKRMETYFEVDHRCIDEIKSDWPVTAFVEPSTTGIESLPHLVYELADIQPADPPRYTGDEARQFVLDAFLQSGQKTRSTSLVFENEANFVDVPEAESRQTVWVGNGIPLNSSKFLLEGYKNHTVVADQAGSNDGNRDSSSMINASVVCNEETMESEPGDIKKVINSLDDFPVELSIYNHLSTHELRQVLKEKTDYLHFVGHASPDGLECSDGMLDVSTIEQSNVSTFFLNACQSFRQGKRLVELGSSGGIVTYSDISDKYALEISGLVVQLLKTGATIGTCLSIIQETTPIGGHYAVVGNHSAGLIQGDDNSLYLQRISEDGKRYHLEVTVYAAVTPDYKIGGLSNTTLDSVERHSIIPSQFSTNVEWPELEEFLSLTDLPVVYEDELITKDTLFETIEQQRSSGTDSSE
ncbi:hypothetical protein [Halovenus salina]|uniref:hypothetical protein n=1 Tax=Halovenus salina TaxID=1510225 RepID=UPI002260F1A7|nr:hypothetical protein [Halovenus salina]